MNGDSMIVELDPPDDAMSLLLDPNPWSDKQIDADAMRDAVVWLDEQLDQWTESAALARPGGIETGATSMGRLDSAVHESALRDLLGRAAPTAVLLGVFNLAVLFDGFLVARVFAIAFLLVVPGAVLIAAGRLRPNDGAVRLSLAAAASVMFLMVVAVVADLGLPLLGVAEPLARSSMLTMIDATLLIVLVVAARRDDPLEYLLGTRLPTWTQIVVAALLAMVPLTAAAGAQLVNHVGDPTLAISALVVAGALLIGVLVTAERVPGWIVKATLYAVAVTVIYSYSFSGDLLFGWDIQQEFQAFSTTMQANAWYSTVDGDPYRAMLSITVLPAVITNLTGMSGVSLFRGVYPLLFASFPVLVYVVATRWLPRVAAFAAAAFVVAQLAFSQQLPAIARQEVALVFFGVLVAIAFDDAMTISQRRSIALAAGASLALTHYSTAYVTALVLVTAWAIGTLVRIVRRRERPPRVFVAWVVFGILGCTVAWNFGVTSSSENVLRFTDQVAERGPEFLPSAEGRSLVGRWLSGNAPQRITGKEYASREALIFDSGAPWLNAYPISVTADYPVAEAQTPMVGGPLPRARDVQPAMLAVVSQAVAALTALGMLAFSWQRRSDWSSARELAIVGVALLGFVAAMRVSGVAAEAYNQERAQIHAAAVLSVGFATALAWFLVRWRRLSLAVLCGALTVLFLASTGLAGRLSGGDPSANLANTGEARERFAVTDAEVATAEWLAANRNSDSLVYTDRYGTLRIWAAAVPIGVSSLQDVLTPDTLDRNAYVFATEANIAGGRARGAIGPDFAVYEFPGAFLDASKATIYSTGSTRIYR